MRNKPQVDDDEVFHARANALRGQMSCPGCGLELLVFDDEGLTEHVRDHIAGGGGQTTVAHGPREGARVLLGRAGEIFCCPDCGHEFLFVPVPPN